jgi:subtilisin family serine protease
MRSFCLLFASCCAGLATTAAEAQRFTPQQQSIAVVSGALPGERLNKITSALLVAERRDNRRGVSLYPNGDPNGEVPARFNIGEPTAIAEGDGDLYAWDDAEKALVAVRLSTGEMRTLWRGEPFSHPTQISVSPDRLIMVVDEKAGGVFWLTTDPTHAFSFGTNTSKYANDGECNDPRFTGEGMADRKKFDAESLHGDASDCSKLVLQGKVALIAGLRPFGTLRDNDFGDNKGPTARNGKCEDPRFVGPGTSLSAGKGSTAAAAPGHDKTDCERAFNDGTAAFRVNANAQSRAGAFGEDDGRFALDGECDDPRFVGKRSTDNAPAKNAGHDATDCRTLFNRGEIDWRSNAPATSAFSVAQNRPSDKIDFGDDSSDSAQDDECDDPRFFGDGMALTLSNSNIGRDATDCRRLHSQGKIRLRDEREGEQRLVRTATAEIDFGDDSSHWAKDGRCDDPRFYGAGASVQQLTQDAGHDATDCSSLYEQGRIRLRSEGTVGEAVAEMEVTAIGRVPRDFEPASSVFFADDTFAVLDRKTNQIVMLRLSTRDGYLQFFDDTAFSTTFSPGMRGKLGDLRAITARNGILYIADQKSVYAYLPNEDRLVPTVSKSFEDIRQIAVNRFDLYVLGEETLERVPRATVLDVVFEAAPEVDQAALLNVLSYLDRSALLEWRSASAQRPYATLEEFLVDQKSLLAPLGAGGERMTSRKGGESFEALRRASNEFASAFCGRNSTFCGNTRGPGVYSKPVPAGTELEVPNLDLRSYLQRETVDLGRETIGDYLQRRVFSSQHLATLDDAVRRLNRELENVPPAELRKQRGKAVLPYEAWTWTISVPRSDYDNKESPFWKATSVDGIRVFSRATYGSKSALTPSGEIDSGSGGSRPATPDTGCNVLKTQHADWLDQLSYPKDHADVADLEVSHVGIGVLEQSRQLLKNHFVFHLDKNNVAWYVAKDFQLQPEAPETGQAEDVHEVERYTVDNHGTHVASLIGGRKGQCWSGLLPESKLVLLDSSDPGALVIPVTDARNANIKVFSVSQDLSPTDARDLRSWMVTQFHDTMFVAAAGNDDRTFGSPLEAPLPAAFGNEPNVVTVTAITPDQTIVGPRTYNDEHIKGANKGKLLVDLAAPGARIYGATFNGMFGRATGTSEAAPAVAAAAAVLLDTTDGPKVLPGDVKARLIAAATWHPGLDGAVWGGMLNFADTVLYPRHNVLQTEAGGSGVFEVVKWKTDAAVKITNTPAPKLYVREAGDGPSAPAKINVEWILSLRSNGDGTHRVVYMEPDRHRLSIILSARLEGMLVASQLKRLNADTHQFEPMPNGNDFPVSVKNITKYIRSLNSNEVQW